MIKPEYIDRIVSQITGVSVELIHTDGGPREVCDARNLAMLKCKQFAGMGSVKLRKYYGKDSHTTILSDLKSARNQIETNTGARLYAADVDCRVELLMKKRLEKKQCYNLHYRIRQKGLLLDMKSKTVSIHPDRRLELEKGQLMKLIKQHGYSVQYSII
jgi:hypothetical protein